MHDMLAEQAPSQGVEAAAGRVLPLAQAGPGDRGVIVEVRAEDHGGVDPQELERRLLEFGFVEGARVEVLHEGLFGADPIAVRLDDMRVALRRRDAQDVIVRLDR